MSRGGIKAFCYRMSQRVRSILVAQGQNKNVYFFKLNECCINMFVLV